MGRDITKRHSLLFDKKLLKNLFYFIGDVYRYQKWRELFSFLIWELSHRLGLFSQEKYLKFKENNVIKLENGTLHDVVFIEKMYGLFKSRGLNATRSEHNWKLLFIDKNGDMFGSFYPNDRDLYKSIDKGKSTVLLEKFPERIKSIFISSQNTIFVCIKGSVYKSIDGGNLFKKCLDLGSSESFFRYNNGMTETPDGTLLIAEYGNVWEKRRWKKLAFLYFSVDNGETWETSDFLIRKGINKHLHIVKYSRLLNKILVADGDNKKKLWVVDSFNSIDLKNPQWNWKVVNRFHIQMGGYTSIVEDHEKIIFGTDYQNGTNFIVDSEDGKKFNKQIVPDPYRRSPIDNMVQRKSKMGMEIWANLPFSTPNSKCLLMYSADGGKNWNKIIEYSAKTHKVWLISSSNETPSELYFSIEDLINNNRVVYKIVDN